MSSEPRHLADWIRALFDALERGEPHTARAIARLAGERSAQIGLDSQRARVAFNAGRLAVRRLADGGVAGAPWGATTSGTVAGLLGGYLEIADAVAEGLIDLQGAVDDVRDICGIIEIFVDASTRIPAMQALSQAFLADLPATDLAAARADRRASAAALLAAEAGFQRRQGWRPE